MNPVPTASFWLESLGELALEVTVLLALAGVAQTWLASPRARRLTWVGALAGLGLILANAVTGADRQVARWWAAGERAQPEFVVRANLPVTAGPVINRVEATELQAATDLGPADTGGGSVGPVAVWWPVYGWLGGVVVVGFWVILPRLLLALAWPRSGVGQPGETLERVGVLAARLGLRRRVRVICSDRLPGPVAYGVWRPTLGLPADFWTRHSRVEQDAMLAHELAHLAGRDPLWLAVADGLVALVWWHPLVWWARRQFRAASEGVADEASVVVEDGPSVLAGCLVGLATRWQRHGLLGLLGMAGFRSGLGRRVERLLRLEPADWTRQRRGWHRLAAGLGSVGAVMTAVGFAAWVLPMQAAHRPALLGMVSEALTGGAEAASEQPAASAPAWVARAEAAVDSVEPSPAAGEERRWLVQVPRVAGMDIETVRRLSMDALTRRLAKLDRFQAVQCEPEGEDRIRLVIRLREANANAGGSAAPAPTAGWSAVPELIVRGGNLEFRRVHPESERLLADAGCPEDCEVVVSVTAGEGPPDPVVQRLVVLRRPAAGLGSTNLSEVTVASNPLDVHPRIAFTFDDAGKVRFAELTRESVGQQIAILLDGKLLMAPRVNAAITGGKGEITGRFTDEEARRLAALLAHPLPAPLRLVESPPSLDGVPTETPADEAADDRVRPSGAASPHPTRAARLVEDARLLYEMGQLNEARVKLEEALRQASDQPAARHLLGLVREAEAARTNAPGHQLSTRTYRLDPTATARSLAALTGAEATNLAASEVFRRLFSAAGVDLGDTNVFRVASNGGEQPSVFQGASGKAVFFNERNGLLLVRATLADLDVVESVVQLLNETPPQVRIDARFVEITATDAKALGFDWYLGNIPMTPGTNVNVAGPDEAVGSGVFPGGPPAGGNAGSSNTAAAPVTLTGILTDPQFRSVITALEANGSRGGSNRPLVDLRGDQLDWPGRTAAQAGNLRISAALGAQLTGVLTDPQYRQVLKALETRGGVDVLAAPAVVTLSGRPAQIQVAELHTVAAGINPAALVQLGTPPGTNAVPFLTSAVPVGPVLDVVPVVAADGRGVALTVLSTITEFLGYDAPPADGTVRVWENGKEKAVALPLPRFRVRQMQTQASVASGGTLVLAGFPVESERLSKDKVPVLGDLPLAGRLFRSESKGTVTKHLLVFVTATIVDPAGNVVAAPARASASAGTVLPKE